MEPVKVAVIRKENQGLPERKVQSTRYGLRDWYPTTGEFGEFYAAGAGGDYPSLEEASHVLMVLPHRANAVVHRLPDEVVPAVPYEAGEVRITLTVPQARALRTEIGRLPHAEDVNTALWEALSCLRKLGEL